ncbi:hypothetical protein [Listeria riparia]|uniref:Uncharacterized protein n=1 Tax=Listeria riparia FSL S10-1204 TaxID=1265816 RepID=W7DA62_9LIST|nr:hypothetical protein [Listeria riparia]EUJ46147.1 hypothetical protein PRIP_03983 [Listeria riparia FSL S10-1204]
MASMTTKVKVQTNKLTNLQQASSKIFLPKKELALKGASPPKYHSTYQEIIDGKDYLYGAYYQKDKIHYLFTFIDKETPEKLELTLQKIDSNWKLTALNPWKTKGTGLTEKEIFNKIGKGTGDQIRIFNRGATFMRL